MQTVQPSLSNRFRKRNPFYGISLTYSGKYLESPTLLVPQTGPFTVEFWVYDRSTSSSYVEFISCPLSGKMFYVGKIINTQNLRFSLCGVQGGVSGFNVPLNTWSHIAISYDGANTFSAYLNGILVFTTTNGTHDTASGSATRIGRQFSPYNEYCDSIISEIKIWDVIRTQAEIHQDMFNAQKNNNFLYYIDMSRYGSGSLVTSPLGKNQATFTYNGIDTDISTSDHP